MRSTLASVLVSVGTLAAVLTSVGTLAAAAGPAQTHFPGQVSAAGGTSGDVMARSGELRNVADEGGTPGIPKGAEGNTGGTQVGASVKQSEIGATGTSSQPSQASKTAQATQASKGASAAAPASSAAKSDAEARKASQDAAKAELAETMDRVAAQWRSRHPASERGHVATQPAPTAARSEKLGTAPASADVKQPKPGASGAAR